MGFCRCRIGFGLERSEMVLHRAGVDWQTVWDNCVGIRKYPTKHLASHSGRFRVLP